ncbi:MAG: hydrogenase expression/formation protein [Aquificota bacterium]|nr:hydrogenase expression/formation protein [Aquificota bacterium]MDQ7083222.1 hydrogenase expression/formation protein [Aquificota bacterium]
MLMNAPAILQEILLALKDLYRKGENHLIYINKMPLSPEDRNLILDTLGDGKVRITYSSGGHTIEWRETGISGVWIGVFLGRDGKPLLETIEITDFPKIAASQKEDIEESIKVLEVRLKSIL